MQFPNFELKRGGFRRSAWGQGCAPLVGVLLTSGCPESSTPPGAVESSTTRDPSDDELSTTQNDPTVPSDPASTLCADYRPAVTGPPITNVFADTTVATYEFCLDEATWTQLQVDARDESYVRVRAWVNGHDQGEIGLRFKGNYGSLHGCFDDDTMHCRRLSMKAKFNEFVPGRHFAGVQRLNFHSLVHDPTLLHERLAYAVYRDLGLPAPQSVHARVLVNGRSLGIFALTEQIEDEFIETRFSTATGLGNLYKERWPDSGNPRDYDEGLTRGDDHSHQAMVELWDSLGDPESAYEALERRMDVHRLLQHLAIDETIGNWDGALAHYCDGPWCASHNHFLYHDLSDGRLQLIVWDLDATWQLATPFDALPHWDTEVKDCSQRHVVFDGFEARPAGCDPLMRTLAGRHGLASTTEASYRAAFRSIADGPGRSVRLQERLDAIMSVLEPAIREDGTYNCMEPWTHAVAQLRRRFELFEARARQLATGVRPTRWSLNPYEPADFEHTDGLSLGSGILVSANSGATIAAELDETGAVAGQRSLALEFALCNTRDDRRGAWRQWAQAELRFADTRDLREFGQLHLRLRSDVPRRVELAIESPHYANMARSGRFQWELEIGNQAREFVLAFDELQLPDWGQAQGDRLEDILARATGIAISVVPTKRNPTTGLFAPGDSEYGRVFVDDIEFRERTAGANPSERSRSADSSP